MIYYFRLDGILGDLGYECYKYYSPLHPSHLPVLNTINFYYFYVVFPYIREYIDRIKCRPEVYQNMIPIEKNIEMYFQYKKEGKEVFIYSTEICWKEKIKWMKKHLSSEKLIRKKDIPKEGVEIFDTKFL